jgi:cysteine desulfurase
MEYLRDEGQIELSFVDTDDRGMVDMDHLQRILHEKGPSLVSLMHANNEIGNLTDIKTIGEICKEHQSVFHSDTVQAVGHYRHDLQDLYIQCMVGSAHKFHGPKGIGFLYLNGDHKICPFIHGGAQERNMRGGTENVTGIVGLAAAMELAYAHMDQHRAHIQGIKNYMIRQLEATVPGVKFNGCSNIEQESLYTVLNVSFPTTEDQDMFLFNLDINGISASGGSACTSGSNAGSHVLSALQADPARASVRFSFSKYNTEEEVDYTVQKIAEIYSVKA